MVEEQVHQTSSAAQSSLWYRRPEFDGVLDACRELGVTPVGFMPLAMGLLSGKYRPGDVPRDWVRRRLTGVFRPTEIAAAGASTARLEAIGAKYGKTPARVALRWVIEQGVIPIPGAKDAKQARQDAGALTFSLTRDEVLELSESASAWVQRPNWKFGPALGARYSRHPSIRTPISPPTAMQGARGRPPPRFTPWCRASPPCSVRSIAAPAPR
ncbi:aldo/keto reductase [Sorangium sp. So ce362]|uniref:aldo/keto reductase n=1 Tax=Sorangium sp. So ce362 TaxID=3133303 RepID=UPI003F5FA5E3